MHVPIEIFMVHSYNKQQNENLHLNDYHLCHGQQVLGKKSKQAESECPLQQEVTEVTIEVRTLWEEEICTSINWGSLNSQLSTILGLPYLWK